MANTRPLFIKAYIWKSASLQHRVLREAVNRDSGGVPRPKLPEKLSPKVDGSTTSGALPATVDPPSSISPSTPITTAPAAVAPVPSHTVVNQEPTPVIPHLL